MMETTPVAMCHRWWHVYMGEVPDMSEDEEGNPGPALCKIIYGESDRDPEYVKANMPTTRAAFGEVDLPYVASFDHDPTDADLAPLLPEGYDA
jgi:hypothetical protein